MLRFRSDSIEPDSILVVRLDQVGDMVQALPFFNALRQKYPKSKITALCAKPKELLLEHCHSVDNVITLESSWSCREEKTILQDLLRVSREIRGAKRNLSLDLRGDMRSTVFLFLSGARRICGYGCTGGDSCCRRNLSSRVM
jgi:ADP-heptose:LPS heptosyltransferase